ncbi:MAG: hypothetical protein QGD89_06260, partial [Actinomycetota bacterium]|nr:hypothetical protein [Actinomycetota bacterium]
MIDLNTQREAVTKAVQSVADGTAEYANKARDLSVSAFKSVGESTSCYVEKVVEFGGSVATSASDTAKTAIEKAQSFTEKGIEKVREVQLGDKNLGERAQATVDTVQEKIDVDQVQDQVAKLRDQVEQVLGSWTDSFRPSVTAATEA